MTTGTWWIRHDLHLTDQQALTTAIGHGDGVIMVFVLDPVLPDSPYAGDKSSRKRDFEAGGSCRLGLSSERRRAMDQMPSSKGWHVAHWPPLAWLETVIKLAAIIIGIVALVQAVSGGTIGLPGGIRLAQWIVMVVLSLGLVVALGDRLAEREIVAMAFLILNNLGHWGMVIALAAEPGPDWMLPAFAALMLLGDLVKLVFLKVHDFTVRDTPKAALYGLTSVYVAGYLLILLLELVR
ncbi:hypothetical protein ACFLTC_02555 [Chloroflexota bacterium]